MPVRCSRSSVENQLKGRAFTQLGADLNVALVAAHDLLGETEADAGPFLFGGEKGDEDLAHCLFLDSFAGIADFQDDLSCFVDESFEYNDFFLCIFQCLNGVLEQIDQDLLDEIVVAKEDQLSGIKFLSQRNPAGLQLML